MGYIEHETLSLRQFLSFALEKAAFAQQKRDREEIFQLLFDASGLEDTASFGRVNPHDHFRCSLMGTKQNRPRR